MHRNILFFLAIYSQICSKACVHACLDKPKVEQILKLEIVHLDSIELTILDQEILNLTQQIDKKYEDMIHLADTASSRAQYEILCKQLQTVSAKNTAQKNLIDSLLSHIDQFVLQSNELLIYIKTLAASVYIHQFTMVQDKPDNLNLIIKPLVKYITKEKFQFLTDVTVPSLWQLIKVMKFENPAPKILKNLFFGYFEEEKSDLVQYNEYDSKRERFESYSPQHYSINLLVSTVIQELKGAVFGKLPAISEQFTPTSLINL